MAANGSKSQEILQQMGVLTPLVNIIMVSLFPNHFLVFCLSSCLYQQCMSMGIEDAG